MSTGTEAIRASSNLNDTVGSLADLAVSEEHPAEEKRLMHAEKTDIVNQATLKDAVVGKPK